MREHGPWVVRQRAADRALELAGHVAPDDGGADVAVPTPPALLRLPIPRNLPILKRSRRR